MNQENLEKGLMALLKFSELEESQYEVKRIYFEDQTTYMNTIIIESDPELPKLVVIHGFGTSGAVHFRMFKTLSKHFNVYLIDIIGMGASYRYDKF